MNIKIKEIVKNGRIGEIVVEVEGRKMSWEWEFGAEGVIAIVSIPTRQQWAQMFESEEYSRDNYLREVAKELIKKECPHCVYEIYNDCLLLVNKREDEIT